MTNPLALTSSRGLTQSLSAGTDMLRQVDWSPMKVFDPHDVLTFAGPDERRLHSAKIPGVEE